MPITIDADTNTYAWSATLRLAERFALTIYDAAYLELAHRHSLPLATLNRFKKLSTYPQPAETKHLSQDNTGREEERIQ